MDIKKFDIKLITSGDGQYGCCGYLKVQLLYDKKVIAEDSISGTDIENIFADDYEG